VRIGITAHDGAARATPLADRSSTKSIALKIGRSTGDERIMSTSNGEESRVTHVEQSQKRRQQS
jgi:hypothetical protein